VLPHQLPSMLVAVREVGDSWFVLDHLAKPAIATAQWDPWATDLAAVAQCENVVAKISGLVTEADWSNWTPKDLREYIDHAVTVFSPLRILFGTDWPVCTLAASYEQLIDVAQTLLGGLSIDDHAAIFGGNAVATYKLDMSLHEAS